MMSRQLIGIAFIPVGLFIIGSAWLRYKADKAKRRRLRERTKTLTRNQDGNTELEGE